LNVSNNLWVLSFFRLGIQFPKCKDGFIYQVFLGRADTILLEERSSARLKGVFSFIIACSLALIA